MSTLKRAAKGIYGAIPFKQPIFKAIRSVVTLPESIYRHLHFKGVVTVPIPGHGEFRIMHHGYMIENELFWRGLDGWEKVSSRLWVLLCRDADVILDIGANTGVYALMAKTVKPTATIVAVEAVERIHRKMKANFDLNAKGIHAVYAAVSDSTGTATLYDMPDSEHVLSVSLDPEWNNTSTRLRPVEVPCRTVADILNEVGCSTVDLLKIDVETHEPAVLQGFMEILRRDRPSMLIELLTDEVADRVSKHIEGLDYLYFNIDDVTWPPPQVERLTRSGHFNFLICRPDVARRIGLLA
jgi:FkbM family methyltransferase